MKVLSLKVTEEEYNALNNYCENKSISKQEWLYGKLEDSFFLLVKYTEVDDVVGEEKEPI